MTPLYLASIATYFASFLPLLVLSLVLYFDVRKRSEFGRRPAIFLLSIGTTLIPALVAVLVELVPVFRPYGRSSGYLALILLGHFVSFLILELSIHDQRIEKSYLSEDLHKNLSIFYPLIAVTALLTVGLFLLFVLRETFAVPANDPAFMSILSMSAENSFLVFDWIGYGLFFILFFISNYLVNARLYNLQAGVIRQKKYPFRILEIAAAVSIVFFVIRGSIVGPIYVGVLAVLNVVFMIRAAKEYLFQRTSNLQSDLAREEQLDKKKNELINRVLHSDMHDELETIMNTVDNALEKARNAVVVHEYAFSGFALYRRDGDILVTEPALIRGYAVPLKDIENFRQMSKAMIHDSLQKQVYDVAKINASPITSLRDLGERVVKTMIETKKRVEIEPLPECFKGLQRLIAVYPVMEKDELCGFAVVYKDSFFKIFPEEDTIMNDLTDDLSVIFSIIAGKKVQRDRTRLQDEMDIAQTIQTSIVPKTIPLPGYESACTMITATEVGGDSFDFLSSRQGHFIGIGDVSGHGLPAGIMALIETSAFHSAVLTAEKLGQSVRPSQIYDIVNRILCNLNRDRIGSDKFMTQNYLVEKDGVFTHAGAHLIALVYRKNSDSIERLTALADRTAFLGLSEHIVSEQSEGSFELAPGDVLVLYTDGLIEAKNLYSAQFGIDRLANLLTMHHESTCEKLIETMIADLTEFAKDGDLKKHAGKFTDDVSIIVLKKK